MGKYLILFVLFCLFVACDQTGNTVDEADMTMSVAGEEVIIPAGDEAGTEAGEMAGIQAGTLAGIEQGGDEGGMQAVDYSFIKLNEINSKGDPFDWVELINLSDQEIDLQGCMLSDRLDEPNRFILPEGVESQIPAQGFLLLLVATDATGFALGNEEGVYLSNPQGELIDSIEYGPEMSLAGTTYGRFPDGTGDWEVLYAETPSAPNSQGTAPVCGDGICELSESCDEDCIVCGDGFCDIGEECAQDCQLDIPLVINEVLAAGSPDGVEIVNTGTEAIELSDIFITDDVMVPFKANLSGMINGGEYLWLEISDETVGFKLKGDEAFYLFDDQGLMIDGVDWEEGDSPEGQSYQRSPDLNGPFVTQTPSPGQANE